MKVKVELPLIHTRLRLGLTLVITLMVISSPVVMLINPALKAAPSTMDGYTSLAPSTIGQDGSDFTAQAPLSSVSARQTNNIVGAFSYYDVVFTTSTGGTIKFIDITFQSGIAIGTAPLLVESEGIGAGTAAKISATQVRYTVTNAVAIPAGTQIRLEFFNLVNPTTPGFYKVTVTTRNAAGTPIDGPTLSSSLNIKQIGSEQIADGAITSTKPAESFIFTNNLIDNPSGNALGWNPDGVTTGFTISASKVSHFDVAFVSILVSGTGGTNHFCDVVDLNIVPSRFVVQCFSAPPDGAHLHYMVTNLPLNYNSP